MKYLWKKFIKPKHVHDWEDVKATKVEDLLKKHSNWEFVESESPFYHPTLYVWDDNVKYCYGECRWFFQDKVCLECGECYSEADEFEKAVAKKIKQDKKKVAELHARKKLAERMWANCK